MPVIECGPGFYMGPSAAPADALIDFGPTLVVDVAFHPSAMSASKEGDPALPQSGPVLALVDTGATESCIDSQLAEELGLPVVDDRKIAGVGGVHDVPVYLGQIVVPQLSFVQHGLFSGVDLGGKKGTHRVLIGRTLLKGLMMIYDGVRGQVTLAK